MVIRTFVQISGDEQC